MRQFLTYSAESAGTTSSHDRARASTSNFLTSSSFPVPPLSSPAQTALMDLCTCKMKLKRMGLKSVMHRQMKTADSFHPSTDTFPTD